MAGPSSVSKTSTNHPATFEWLFNGQNTMNIEFIEAASSEIAEYNQTEAGLADLRARMQGVEYIVTTTAGMAVAKADRAEVRGLRTGLENMRKKIKAPALAHAKRIDEEAKRITAALLELEEPIDLQIKAEEQRKEIERATRELLERNRITEINRRIAELRSYQALAAGCRTSAAIQSLIDKLAAIELTGFEEFEDEAKTARVETMHRMEEAHAQKFADEADRIRVKAEQDAAAAELAAARAELATAKAEQDAITKRNRDAAIAEADRLETERQALEDEQAKARAERQAFDERVKAKQAEDDLAAYKEATDLAVVEPVAIELVASPAPIEAEVLVLTGDMVSITAPSAIAIIQAIAALYVVSEATAAEWLDAADFSTYY